MSNLQLTITSAERDYLIARLETALGEVRVEAHRTHQPGYRAQVLDEEALVRDLLGKLRETA